MRGGAGAAGSLVLLLMWVNYSSLILLFGAAFTKAQPQADANAKKAFFTGWAGLWARQDKATALAAAQATANHAPAKWRVNGPLANFPAFGQAFACKGRVAMQKPANFIAPVFWLASSCHLL